MQSAHYGGRTHPTSTVVVDQASGALLEKPAWPPR